ncbi:molybdate ABC transporter substrate-binding protein [Elioraea sp. Yellowstone]|jgi:molybdate transport system substrate-binding protein|uniref:molybdate ABC transporter substrate-binding protein n=1 Tax=Elioraea sp. Yellowstone TaxID=2592070 RepID=UPI00114E661F|nr:molybdate ABC transporter substrate-binding protein [Elioraea sp. Yellowstone]TQF77540.1 molybdate ABC transporter substrate-binding protein [Elioraea sp. Yellowstone]
MPNPVRRAALAALFAALPSLPLAREAPAIAAAADLHFALAEVAERFRADGHGTVRLSVGSSGNFARQIEQGAPFQVFLSADEAFVFRLADRGLTRDRGVLYAIGRIVIFIPTHSDLVPDGTLADLRAAIEGNRLHRFAIAHPEHAPYGRAAMQALRNRGLWDGIQRALVLGENVSQAAQFALTGSSQGGIVAYSLVLAPAMKDRGRFALIPEEWHEPLRQRMVLLRNATPVAERFYAYMQEKPAREIMVRHGFVLPGE